MKVMQTRDRKSILGTIQPPRDGTVQTAVTAIWFVLSRLDQVMPLCLDQVAWASLLRKRDDTRRLRGQQRCTYHFSPSDPKQSVQCLASHLGAGTAVITPRREGLPISSFGALQVAAGCRWNVTDNGLG
uniref:Uncharacterized protein n=1 Tax=Molossus molossus TaxID=27622 RepID=A0A7J8E2X1_MOLMO|nr:hypothetical protein HJG59_009067 [Molossus molossus]